MLSEMIMLVGIALVLTVTPGPDTFLVLRNALTYGAATGRKVAWGIVGGLLFHATLAGLGLSVILVHSAQAYAFVRWCGAAYLIWLGLKALYPVWRAGGLREAAHETPTSYTREPIKDARKSKNAFYEGLITNILNPKVAVFYLAVLPQVMGAQPETWRAIWFAGAHVVVTLGWFFLLSAGCDKVGSLLRPVVLRRLDALAGVLMLAFGIRLACANDSKLF